MKAGGGPHGSLFCAATAKNKDENRRVFPEGAKLCATRLQSNSRFLAPFAKDGKRARNDMRDGGAIVRRLAHGEHAMRCGARTGAALHSSG